MELDQQMARSLELPAKKARERVKKTLAVVSL